jgi:hypothetical protein
MRNSNNAVAYFLFFASQAPVAKKIITFQKRLKTVAGFEFVPDPLPMRNSNNAVAYFLFFASQAPVAKKIITDIFKKYRA